MAGKFNSGLVSTEDCPETWVSYSGAAKRHYRKRFQKEKEAVKVQTSLFEAIVNSGIGGGGALAAAPKHARTEPNILSPTGTRQSKITDQESYAQATKGKLASCQASPHFGVTWQWNLETAECDMIRRRVLELFEDIKALTFSGSWEMDGALIHLC